VKEARKLGIPTVCLIDTDSDPDFADIPIPGNDDAMRAIEVVIKSLCAAVQEGKTSRVALNEGRDSESPAEAPRKRSSRSQFRADGPKHGSGADGAADDEAAEHAAVAEKQA
jgi:small subunit ribosomal protein S2